MPRQEEIIVVLAEDDPDDQFLVREALVECKLPHRLDTVNDGQELMDYLHDAATDPSRKTPNLILLDLNLPRLDGHQVLERLRENEVLRSIPVVVLTTSKAEEDVVRSYHLGAGGYITKPVSFEGLVSIMQSLDHYWFKMVKLPNR